MNRNPPLLKLVFEKGPREGDSLQYNPGSTIHIGRLAHGDEIAGISTKNHHRIVSDSDHWMIINDLGSHDGTMLNSVSLRSDSPVNLCDGDVITLGVTSIVIKFESDVASKMKKKKKEEKLPPTSRQTRSNTCVLVSDPDPKPVHKKAKGKFRSLKKIYEEEGTLKKKVEIPDTKRVAKGKQIVTETFVVMENVKSEAIVLQKKDFKRITRSATEESGEYTFLQLDMAPKINRKSGSTKTRKQKPQVEETEHKNSEEIDGKRKEAEETSRHISSDKVDLSKMTLGEWFDYMEVYLRKTIMDETEEMIEGLRSKARRVREYIAEEKQKQRQEEK